MNESTGAAFSISDRAVETVHEAYAFACMRCSHAWEQSYAIEHHLDADGRTVVIYFADGRRVPSPLTRPRCANCEGHIIRIMRSGAVSDIRRRGAGRMEPQTAEGKDTRGSHGLAGAKERTGSEQPPAVVGGPDGSALGAVRAWLGQHWHLPQVFHRDSGGRV